jgi:hypothetical protein
LDFLHGFLGLLIDISWHRMKWRCSWAWSHARSAGYRPIGLLLTDKGWSACPSARGLQSVICWPIGPLLSDRSAADRPGHSFEIFEIAR